MRAHQFLWRMCESYELWCKEAGKSEKIVLNINYSDITIYIYESELDWNDTWINETILKNNGLSNRISFPGFSLQPSCLNTFYRSYFKLANKDLLKELHAEEKLLN